MTKIKYTLANGKEIQIEVSDSCATEYVTLERHERLCERKETRRHQSLEKSLEGGFEFKDDRVDTLAKIIVEEEKDDLHKAITKLLPQQQELVRKIYFEEKTIKEIAEEENVSHQAISDRLQKILKKIKSFLF